MIGLTTCVNASYNQVMLLEMSENEREIYKVAQCNEYYPATKIQWMPHKPGIVDNLFATSSDALRLYQPSVN